MAQNPQIIPVYRGHNVCSKSDMRQDTSQGLVACVVREYYRSVHFCIRRKKIGRTRASDARGCENAAPAAMPPPTEAREGHLLATILGSYKGVRCPRIIPHTL